MMHRLLTLSVTLGALGCGGAPEKRTIADPVPNVPLTERRDDITDPDVLPPVAGRDAAGVSAPVQAQPMTADTPPPPPPCDAEDDACRIERLGSVRVGWLREGMPYADIVAKLGEPTYHEGLIEEGATGEWVTTSRWQRDGIGIIFSADTRDGEQTARNIDVTAPFDGKTERGIGIGSTEDEVRAAYGAMLDPRGGPDALIAGSVYGGITFGIDDQGRVARIMMGPGAE